MVWKGTATSKDWNTKENWYDVDRPDHVAQGVPGEAGHTGDTVKFDSTAINDCELNASVTVAGLTLDGGTSAFAKTLTIKPDQQVIVKDGTFEFDAGTINFDWDEANNSWLRLDNSTGNWKGGDFSSGSAGGVIYVYNNSTLNITQDAQALGASLVIGQTPTGSELAGTVNLTGMSGNLKLYKNATITNYADGILDFKQNANSDSKGGIDVDASSTASKIVNKGLMKRVTLDQGGKTLNSSKHKGK